MSIDVLFLGLSIGTAAAENRVLIGEVQVFQGT